MSDREELEALRRMAELEARSSAPVSAAPGSVSDLLGGMASQSDPLGGSQQDFGSAILENSLAAQDYGAQATETSKDIGLNAMKIGAAIAAPPLLGTSATGLAGAKLLPRLGAYALEGATSAGAVAGVEQAAQLGGLTEAKPASENFGSLAGDFALDMAVPGAIDVIGSGVKQLARTMINLNPSSARVLTDMGATATNKNPLKGKKFVIRDLEAIKEGEPGLYGEMLKNLHKPEAVLTTLDGHLDKVGGQIKQVYQKNPIDVPLSSLRETSPFKKLEEVVTKDFGKGKAEKALAQKAMDELTEVTGGGRFESVPLPDLWEARRGIDEDVYAELKEVPKAKKYFEQARASISDAIDKALKNSSLTEAEDLRRLNKSYHHSANLRQVAGQGVGKIKTRKLNPLLHPIQTIDDNIINSPRLAKYGEGSILPPGGGVPPRGVQVAQELMGEEEAQASELDLFAPPQQEQLPIPGSDSSELDLFAPKGVPTAAPIPEPFGGGLPRDTDQWNEEAVEHLLMATSMPNLTAEEDGEPQMEAHPVVKEMVRELHKGLRAGDKDKVTMIVSDIAKMFPEHFEPGVGVDGKIFDPEEQSKYMSKIEDGVRSGHIESSFLAEQRDAFLNRNNQKVLPLRGLIPPS